MRPKCRTLLKMPGEGKIFPLPPFTQDLGVGLRTRLTNAQISHGRYGRNFEIAIPQTRTAGTPRDTQRKRYKIVV